MNLPNLLTLIRFALIPTYFFVFFSNTPYNMLYALMILLLAGFTDILDGYLARRYQLVTDFGIILDPLADKMMMLSVLLSLVIDGRVSWLVAGLLIFRDVGMIAASGFFHFRGKKTVPAIWLGKSTTVIYYVTLVAVLFSWSIANVLLWITVIFSFLTSFVYLQLFRQINPRVNG